MKLRVKIEIALLAALLLSICGLFTISKWTTKTDFVRFENADMRRHGRDGREMPTNSNVNFTFRVESPSSFFIENMRDVNGPHVDGIAFKLLGIKEPIGDERRQKAVEFIKKWLINIHRRDVARDASSQSNRCHASAATELDDSWIGGQSVK